MPDAQGGLRNSRYFSGEGGMLTFAYALGDDTVMALSRKCLRVPTKQNFNRRIGNNSICDGESGSKVPYVSR